MSSEPKIEFVTNVKGLADIEDCRPKPTKKFMPDWWKNMPHPKDLNPKDRAYPEVTTAKVCPAFPDFFSMGYVLPMWADTTLRFSPTEDRWEARCGREGSPFIIEIHGYDQFMRYVPETNFQGVSSNIIFHFNNPWHLRTPKGYSVLQLPMFYHFNKDFSAMPGIIDTDIHPIINIQVLYHGRDKEIFIPRGTPLVQYIPIKREDDSLEVGYVDDDFQEWVDRLRLEIATNFHSPYRQLQREAKKK